MLKQQKFIFPLLILLFIHLSSGAWAQDGYKIDLKIRGLKDTTAYLGFYFQEKIFIKDTTQVDSKGEFVFQGSTSLPGGMYLVVLDKTKIFDFLIGRQQHFSLETSADGSIENMAVKGDEDNRLFFENMRFSFARTKEGEPFFKIVKDSTLSEEDKKAAREKLEKLNDKIVAYQQSVVDHHPLTLTAHLMKMNKPVVVPDPPKNADGKIDSAFQLRYYRQHYFDNFDLSEDALLRLPKVFYWEKVKDYLDRLFIQQPDTITKAINGLVQIAKKNKDTYKYLVWNCIVNYQNPDIMGLDEVYINLCDQYISTGEMDYWLDKKTRQNLEDYANRLRHALIGTTAPNLIMQNENLQPLALYDIKNKYTIIYFFKPTCSHCRHETPKLVDFYNANKEKFDLEVFAVATDTSMKEMRDFIKEFKTPWPTVSGPRSYLREHFMHLYYADQTPMVYITDKNKKIIARKIPVEQIGDFLTNYEKMMDRKLQAEALKG